MKVKRWLTLALLALSSITWAADGVLFNVPKQTPFGSGAVIAGAQVFFYEDGTTTKQNTYTAADLVTPHANPVVADADGKLPAIFLDPNLGDYKVVITTASDSDPPIAAIDTVDNYPSTISSSVIGLALYPQTARELAAGVTPSDYTYPELNILRYGGGTAKTQAQNTTALTNAIQVFRGGTGVVLSSPAITAYVGGEIFFPAGIYTIDFDTFEFDDVLNVTLVGEGSRFEQNYFDAPTIIRCDGTSTGYCIRVDQNGARNFGLRNLALEYADSAFTGDLIEIEDAVGWRLENVHLGHQKDGAAVYSAASLINLSGDSKFGKIDYVSFDEADKGLITSAFGGNDPSAFTVSNSVFNDLATSQVEIDDSEQKGVVFIGNDFDPVNLKIGGSPITNGLKMGGSGWSVIGNTFAGSDLNAAPSTAFAELSGNGVFIGNRMLTNETGLITKGVIEVSGNRIAAKLPVQIDAGSVITGGSNKYDQNNSGTIAVEISPSSGSVIVDIGPDVIGSGFTDSYKVTTDASATYGQVKYAADKDGSTSGPNFQSEHVRLNVLNKEVISETATDSLTFDECGKTVNNNGAAGAVVTTLPTAVAGCEFIFYKVTNQQWDLAAGASDVFIMGLAAGATDSQLTNAADEVGAVVWVIAVNNTHWLVLSISGTWT